jgi:hypothetical protein
MDPLFACSSRLPRFPAFGALRRASSGTGSGSAMTGADDPDSDTEVPICVRPEVVALACSRVRSMGEEVPHSMDSSERLSDNPR